MDSNKKMPKTTKLSMLPGLPQLPKTTGLLQSSGLSQLPKIIGLSTFNKTNKQQP